MPKLTTLTTPTITQPPLPHTLPSLQPPIPATLPSLHPPNPDTLNPIHPPPTNPTGIQDDECFYHTEIEDELELPSTSQLSGSKELRANPPEDEINSKKSRMNDPPHPTLL